MAFPFFWLRILSFSRGAIWQCAMFHRLIASVCIGWPWEYGIQNAHSCIFIKQLAQMFTISSKMNWAPWHIREGLLKQSLFYKSYLCPNSNKCAETRKRIGVRFYFFFFILHLFWSTFKAPKLSLYAWLISDFESIKKVLEIWNLPTKMIRHIRRQSARDGSLQKPI